MRPNAAFRHCIVALFFVGMIVLACTNSNADDDLESLVAQYAKYGLPQPPKQAKLVVLKWSNSTANGVPQYERAIALLEPKDPDGEQRYWIGHRTSKLSSHVSVTPTLPRERIVAATDPGGPDGLERDFDRDPDLALAIVCASRGWNELAGELLIRSRRAPRNVFQRRAIRPRDHGKALALLAWDYWCGQFCRQEGDRSAILTRLTELKTNVPGLDTLANENIVNDMRLTLQPTKSPVDSLEATIDSLIHLGVDRPGAELIDLRSVGFHPSYKKIEAMGLDAVPILLKHTHDFRMTRFVTSNHRGPWIVRIADVVHQLLSALAGEELSHDILVREGRGRCVDRDHVLFWWSETKKVDAKEFLIQNAITAGDDGKPKANLAILKSLARSYPDDLVDLFTKNFERLEYADPLLQAVGSAKLSEHQKSQLFLKAASAKRAETRASSIRQLLAISHQQAVPLLVAELDRIPRTPKKAYWLSSAGPVSQVLCHTDSDVAWSALARNAKRVDMGQRLQMMQAVTRSGKKKQTVAFFVEFLNDDETRELPGFRDAANAKDIDAIRADLFSGPSAGFMFSKLSVRDYAALQIARILDVPANTDSSWTASEWKSLRQKVREAIKVNGQ